MDPEPRLERKKEEEEDNEKQHQRPALIMQTRQSDSPGIYLVRELLLSLVRGLNQVSGRRRRVHVESHVFERKSV